MKVRMIAYIKCHSQFHTKGSTEPSTFHSIRSGNTHTHTHTHIKDMPGKQVNVPVLPYTELLTSGSAFILSSVLCTKTTRLQSTVQHIMEPPVEKLQF